MPSAKPKENEASENRLGSRTSDRVESRLNPYIAAHPKDMEYYQNLVTQNPERAARTLMLKDLEKFEETSKRIQRQLPQAKEFYEKQTPEVKARIDEAVAKVNPFHHDQAFVGEVTAEVRRQSFKQVFGKQPAAGMAVG
jgi:hypothetical protein